jgi:hypothetical protein
VNGLLANTPPHTHTHLPNEHCQPWHNHMYHNLVPIATQQLAAEGSALKREAQALLQNMAAAHTPAPGAERGLLMVSAESEGGTPTASDGGETTPQLGDQAAVVPEPLATGGLAAPRRQAAPSYEPRSSEDPAALQILVPMNDGGAESGAADGSDGATTSGGGLSAASSKSSGAGSSDSAGQPRSPHSRQQCMSGLRRPPVRLGNRQRRRQHMARVLLFYCDRDTVLIARRVASCRSRCVPDTDAILSFPPAAGTRGLVAEQALRPSPAPHQRIPAV